jgi:hypothetical protein
MSDDTGAGTGPGPIESGQETCAWCPKRLADAHAEPAGYTALTTAGEEICNDCADARR